MEAYLPISYLNDFIFCPRSIYFHQLYGQTSRKTYQQTPQLRGLAAHRTIDNHRYSSKHSVLQAMDVYSDKYHIAGKIDLFDIKTGLLSERKKKIKVVYDGYIYQVYAQYFAIKEMGYEVTSLRLYSMDDNKIHPITKPEEDQNRLEKFELLLKEIRAFDLDDTFEQNPKKCANCIYNNLCDIGSEQSC